MRFEATAEQVNNFSFPGVNIREKLSWASHTRILTKVAPRQVKVNTVTGNTTEDFTDHSLHVISRFTLIYGFYICIYGTTNYSSSFSNGQNKALTFPIWLNTLSFLCCKINYKKMMPHLESHFDGCISNLVDIWQRASVVKPSIGSQLQILGFLQLQLTAGWDETWDE